ncbi:MAG TPA: lipid A biosynthesis lauroyl acyltransferase [Alphaproteobacteria bacterium]|nr:lipid A biosynthesis lauroyl acyltransferase [Alphaproteobacteria bacterium]
MLEWRTPVSRALGTVVHWIEGVALLAAFAMFRLMPLDWASALGGHLCRTYGRFLPVSRYAKRNLRAAYPEKSDAEIRKIFVDMWENLGRMFGEYPHLGGIRLYEPGSRVEVINPEYLDHLRDDGKPGIFFSAHIGNWEIASMGATQRDLPLIRIYRAPNNPLVDRLARWTRRKITGELLPKGEEGARRTIAMMRKGGHLGILVDQKLNNGIPVPFFGRPAMTAPSLAQLALKFDCPVIPARVVRLNGAHFRLFIYPPLEIVKTGDRAHDTLALMIRVNAIIEGWVREYPGQWLWLHRRWPD